MRRLLFSFSLVWCAGCAAASAGPAPTTPEAPPPASTAPPPAPVLGSRDPIIPDPPASCEVFKTTSGAEPCPSSQALLAAVSEAGPEALLRFESCERFEPGLIRALVAELAPMACADLIVESAGKIDPPPELREVLTALGIAGRLSRLVGEPPRLAPPFDAERFREFMRSQLAPWLTAQSQAISDLAKTGAGLTGYAQGVVAIQAGLADLRMVELMRGVALPEELAGDDGLEEAYFSSLDQALEPRKTRGRDAALVGLRRFREQGAIEDHRLSQAHRLLSTLYNGRRIDRLSGLMLPQLAKPGSATALPTYYANRLLSEDELTTQLGAVVTRGIPTRLKERVEAPGQSSVSPAQRLEYALAVVQLGQRYVAQSEFKRAAALAQPLASSPGRVGEIARLLRALGTAFDGAPRDAAHLILQGLGGWQPQLSELDRLAGGAGEVAGMAGFNAALLRELTVPADAGADTFEALAVRYERASAKLGGELEERALASAQAMRETAKAVTR
ncbi:MAG: hypothetical protein KIT72_15050 [Polyangiaceae bacterium]|nr:hypothetical protein [Polyangiaceae bacterium]MCW5791734.1 hypothetical protein [Polyangiaceae bacterium]